MQDCAKTDIQKNDPPNYPLFSIVTSVLNARATIEDCVTSVLNQSFRDYEHIVIDGASNDGTKEFLESKRQQFSVLISEPDAGIYNAWNKGLNFARGTWILFLGADDVLADREVLADTADFIRSKNITGGIIYGDLVKIDRGNSAHQEFIHVSPEVVLSPKSSKIGFFLPPHPSVFHNRSLFDEHGYFDETYKISADTKFLLHACYVHDAKISYFPRIITRMDTGGVSSRHTFRKMREGLRLHKELGIKIPALKKLNHYVNNSSKIFITSVFGDHSGKRIIKKIVILKQKMAKFAGKESGRK